MSTLKVGLFEDLTRNEEVTLQVFLPEPTIPNDPPLVKKTTARSMGTLLLIKSTPRQDSCTYDFRENSGGPLFSLHLNANPADSSQLPFETKNPEGNLITKSSWDLQLRQKQVYELKFRSRVRASEDQDVTWSVHWEGLIGTQQLIKWDDRLLATITSTDWARERWEVKIEPCVDQALVNLETGLHGFLYLLTVIGGCRNCCNADVEDGTNLAFQ